MSMMVIKHTLYNFNLLKFFEAWLMAQAMLIFWECCKYNCKEYALWFVGRSDL